MQYVNLLYAIEGAPRSSVTDSNDSQQKSVSLELTPIMHMKHHEG